MSLMHIYTSLVCHSCISIDSILVQWLFSSTSRCKASFSKKGEKKITLFWEKSVMLLNKLKLKNVTLFLFHKLSIKAKTFYHFFSFFLYPINVSFFFFFLILFPRHSPPPPLVFSFFTVLSHNFKLGEKKSNTWHTMIVGV